MRLTTQTLQVNWIAVRTYFKERSWAQKTPQTTSSLRLTSVVSSKTQNRWSLQLCLSWMAKVSDSAPATYPLATLGKSNSVQPLAPLTKQLPIPSNTTTLKTSCNQSRPTYLSNNPPIPRKRSTPIRWSFPGSRLSNNTCSSSMVFTWPAQPNRRLSSTTIPRCWFTTRTLSSTNLRSTTWEGSPYKPTPWLKVRHLTELSTNSCNRDKLSYHQAK